MRPVLCRWDGLTFHPAGDYWERLARSQLTQGEMVVLSPVEERTAKSHNHYFASLRDIWQSLPDMLLASYPTPEHMRKRALIETGWCDIEDWIPGKGKSFATDGYCIMISRGGVVRVYKPKSQGVKAMGKRDFEQSKRDVLDWCEGLLERRRA